MRIGFNPNKDKETTASDFFHQVIVPVYIPNNEGYFKDSLQIFRYCLESLFKTCHPKTYFTVVNNGSGTEVIAYIDNLYREGKVHEIIHTTGIGKLNAILKGISGQKFDLITIADSDVLFLNGWQKETYAVFDNFPKTGAVCPTPSSKVLKQYTFNVLLECFFSDKLRFTPTKNREALVKFAESIGNPNFYNIDQLSYNLSIANENCKAVIGAGHFVTTYKGVVFNNATERYSKFSLGGDSETKLLDEPVANQGYWRLSTEDNFTYHMGNVTEAWMEEYMAQLKDESAVEVTEPKLETKKNAVFFNNVKKMLFSKIIARQPFWCWFLQYKGLSKAAAKNY